MTSTSSSGSSVVTLQFSLDLDLDVAEQGVQAGINAALDISATGSSQPAGLQQGQPGRRADSDTGADVGDAASIGGGGFYGNPVCW